MAETDYQQKKYPTVLSIAGSDSIGGAGIQADIKTCTALGVYAMTVITAITAQNTTIVKAIMPVPTEMIYEQLNAVFSDQRPDVVKIGMLGNADTVMAVAEFLDQQAFKAIVLDPVMVSTSGSELTKREAASAMKEALIPLCTLLTPNLPEAAILAGHECVSAKELQGILNCQAVLLKGGHQDSDSLTDTLATADGEIAKWTHKHICTHNTHGTGCTLSSAIAAHMALGHRLEDAVDKSISWLQGAIESGKEYKLGSGHGPVNHLYKITQPS